MTSQVDPRILVAEPDDTTRLFLAENVARHIFGLLWPDWLCARPRDGAAVTAVGSVAQGRWGT